MGQQGILEKRKIGNWKIFNYKIIFILGIIVGIIEDLFVEEVVCEMEVYMLSLGSIMDGQGKIQLLQEEDFFVLVYWVIQQLVWKECL